MKHLPKIYPISLLALIVFLLFVGAWAISETALNGPEVAFAGTTGAPDGSDPSTAAYDSDRLDWYEEAAVWFCPLH